MPDWVDGEPSKFPNSQYLTAVGDGNLRQAAEEDARSELSRIFRSKIVSDIRTYEKFLQLVTSESTKVEDKAVFENITTISTQNVIEGSKVVARHSQKEPKIHYALVALDRDKAARILREKIGELDRELDTRLSQAGAATDKLTRLRNLSRAVPKFALRDASNAQLRIVENGSGIPKAVNFEDVRAELENLLFKDLAIVLEVKGFRANELRSTILRELSKKNLPVVKSRLGRSFDLKVEIESNLELNDRSKEFYDADWSVHSRMLDGSGKELSTTVQKGSGGYVNRKQAEQMSMREINQQVPEAIRKQVAKFLLGE